MRAILAETSIDVDHVNNLGWTALLEAVILGDGGPAHVEIVRLLLDGRRGPLDRRPRRRDRARACTRRGYDEMVALLDAS